MVGMPGQMQSGPLPNVACPSQMAGQIPAQMRVQLPGQMGGQLQGQIQGQSLSQMPQMPGQMPGQMNHMAQMQQPRKVSGCFLCLLKCCACTYVCVTLFFLTAWSGCLVFYFCC